MKIKIRSNKVKKLERMKEVKGEDVEAEEEIEDKEMEMEDVEEEEKEIKEEEEEKEGNVEAEAEEDRKIEIFKKYHYKTKVINHFNR